jgi:hypothetical protein
VSYTPPTVLTSGVTWTGLRSLGFHGTLAQVAQVNSFAPNLVSRLKSPATVADAFRAYAALVDRFLAGDPISSTETVNRATDFAKVFHAIAQAADDINALIVANPGTLRDVVTRPVGNGTTIAGQFVQRKRTWP